MKTKLSDITYKDAVIIGLFQLIAAIFPGTSRSGATIVGAIIFGVSRGLATEFTFFLAIPVMFGASLLKILKFGLTFTGTEISVLLIGMIVAFIVSMISIKFLTDYVKKHDFTVFGWYRIILGIIVSLACLTTSIGLTSSAASYFSNISNGKLKYQTLVIGICVFSLILANFGVSTIIQFSAPVLEIVCPVLVALIGTTFLDKYIKNDNAFKGVAYVTLLISILSVGSSLFTLTQISNLLSKLPLAQYGFNWVLPAILGGVVGAFIKTKSNVRVNKKIG